MRDFETKLTEWIERNFDMTQVRIHEGLPPHMRLVRYNNGEEVLVYWDFNEEKAKIRTESKN